LERITTSYKTSWSARTGILAVFGHGQRQSTLDCRYLTLIMWQFEKENVPPKLFWEFVMFFQLSTSLQFALAILQPNNFISDWKIRHIYIVESRRDDIIWPYKFAHFHWLNPKCFGFNQWNCANFCKFLGPYGISLSDSTISFPIFF
jgi:hypothetical protein